MDFAKLLRTTLAVPLLFTTAQFKDSTVLTEDPTQRVPIPESEKLSSILLWKRSPNTKRELIPQGVISALKRIGFLDIHSGTKLLESMIVSVKDTHIFHPIPNDIVSSGMGTRATFFYNMVEQWTPVSKIDEERIRKQHNYTHAPALLSLARRAAIQISFSNVGGVKSDFYLIVTPDEVVISIQRDYPYEFVSDPKSISRELWKPIISALKDINDDGSINAPRLNSGHNEKRFAATPLFMWNKHEQGKSVPSKFINSLRQFDILGAGESGEKFINAIRWATTNGYDDMSINPSVFEEALGGRRVILYNVQTAKLNEDQSWNIDKRIVYSIASYSQQIWNGEDINNLQFEFDSKGVSIKFHSNYPWWTDQIEEPHEHRAMEKLSKLFNAY